MRIWKDYLLFLVQYCFDLINFNLTLDKVGFIYRYIDEIIFSENEINEEGYEKLFQISKKQISDIAKLEDWKSEL